MFVFVSIDLFVYAHLIVILVFVMSMITFFIVILVFVMMIMMLIMAVITTIVLARKTPITITFRTHINSNIVDIRFSSHHRFGCPNFVCGCHR